MDKQAEEAAAKIQAIRRGKEARRAAQKPKHVRKAPALQSLHVQVSPRTPSSLGGGGTIRQQIDSAVARQDFAEAARLQTVERTSMEQDRSLARKLFNSLNQDNDGTISFLELQQALRENEDFAALVDPKRRWALSAREVAIVSRELEKGMDADGDGEITEKEFEDWVFAAMHVLRSQSDAPARRPSKTALTSQQVWLEKCAHLQPSPGGRLTWACRCAGWSSMTRQTALAGRPATSLRRRPQYRS